MSGIYEKMKGNSQGSMGGEDIIRKKPLAAAAVHCRFSTLK